MYKQDDASSSNNEVAALQSLDNVQEEAKSLTAAPPVNRALKDTYPALTR